MDEQVFQERIPLLLRGPSVMQACRCPVPHVVRAPNLHPRLPALHSFPDIQGRELGTNSSPGSLPGGGTAVSPQALHSNGTWRPIPG